MESTEGSADCLPIDFLRFLFVRLSARDLCAAACTCRLWDQLTRECWRAKAQRRWRHGGTKWRSLALSGEWKQLYRERHMRDCATRAALRDLPWPVRREAALATLVVAGDDALDELLAAATAAAPQGSMPPSALTRSDCASRRRGPRLLGQQYWTEVALAALRKREAVSLLHKLAKDSRIAEERPEAGALAIAQAHYPTADLRGVERELAALASELQRRMRVKGAPTGSLQALQILNQLLFGPIEPSSSVVPCEGPYVLQPAAAAVLVKLAGSDGGLGMRGCEADDYYNPANSMLCDVLARRRGIPISLALLHLAVARRAGLGGRLELIGLPTRVVNRFIPTAKDAEGQDRRGADQSGSSIGTCAGGEVFIDVFGGGTLLSWSQLRSKMVGLGVPVQRSHIRALSPGQIYDRMCTNLYSIYRNAGDMSCLRLVLELCGAVAEQSRDLLVRRYRVSLSLEDWTDAAECLEAMTASIAAAPLTPPSLDVSTAAGTAVGGMDEHLRQQLTTHMSKLRRDLDDRRSAWQSSSVVQKHRPPSVLFSVGTMIQHGKYGYRGVIVDWDTSCRMDDAWIKQMGVDSLPGGGRQQPFYRVLVSDRARSNGNGGSSSTNGGGSGGSSNSDAAAASGGASFSDSYSTGGDAAAEADTTAAAAAAAAAFAEVPGPYGAAYPQIWQAEGFGSQLRGLHNRPRAEETYVAQVNVQLVVPMPPPPPTPAAVASPPRTRMMKPYERLEARGLTLVAVPYDFEVDHPDLGYYFEGKMPGAPHYRLNAALRHRFPADCEEWDTGSVGAGDCGECAEAWDWQIG
ncbi:hypothetical protein Vretifemale_3703, partial [Volvox reticuliferus]